MSGRRSPGSFLRFDRLLSLKYLLFIGFVIAVIPLFLAVLYAAFAMRENAAMGKTAFHRVAEETKTARWVAQKVSDIERKARLFVLLADPALRQPYERQSYENARASFKQAVNELLKMKAGNKIALLVNELSEKERLIYEQIIGSETDNQLKLPVDAAFQGFREAANALGREIDARIDGEAGELQQQSESLEQGLLYKGGILLLVSLVFIITLLVVLSRSIRQLDASIRRLGAGNFADSIVVTGPFDLRQLGERLEWLRGRLLELDESKQLFMHNVAREIEAPLASIGEGVGQLADETVGELNPLQRDIALMLCANTQKLQTVSEELVRYSRIHADPLRQIKETVDMKALLESVLEDHQTPLKAKSLTVKELVQPVEFSGDPEQLRAIVDQLVANAVKFSPVAGEIRIMLRASGAQMELEVEDEGPGIDVNERSHVFEPFFRGKAAADVEGSGLGLAIVSEYVANHQGKVDIVEPRQDQQGARIRVQIPLN
ncbi:MAG: HAMP domain-containing sensor histidine kinase [Methylococcaceae bacterium]|nr:HAMP domain-containing sensor histidine kinase [Methylococcaceae bacterium]